MAKDNSADQGSIIAAAKRELRSSMPSMPWELIERAALEVPKANPSASGEELRRLIVEAALSYWSMNP